MSNSEQPSIPVSAEKPSPLQIWARLTGVMAFRVGPLAQCLEASENGFDFILPATMADHSARTLTAARQHCLVGELAEFCRGASSEVELDVSNIYGMSRRLCLRKTIVAQGTDEPEVWLVAREADGDAASLVVPEMDELPALRLKVGRVAHALNNVLTMLYCRCDVVEPSLPGETMRLWPLRTLVNLVAEQVRMLTALSLNAPRQ